MMMSRLRISILQKNVLFDTLSILSKQKGAFMKFHRIVITLFTLCTASLLSMKQIKLIHDAMKHEKGLDLIGHAIEISQNHTPYHTDTQPHVYFVQHLKKYGKTLYPELMRKKLEYGGITAAHLVYPCPDTFMRTIAPLLHETDSGEILVSVCLDALLCRACYDP